MVRQAQNERNYHVFYYVIAGSSDIDKSAFFDPNSSLTSFIEFFFFDFNIISFLFVPRSVGFCGQDR